MSILFPYRFKGKIDKDPSKGPYFIPEADQWFQFDEHKGKETFFLLASAEPLGNLEALINNFESVDSIKKGEFGRKILNEIKKLKAFHSNLRAAAEKPLSIIGNIRGVKKPDCGVTINLAEHAVEISASTFYSRTFIIDHR